MVYVYMYACMFLYARNACMYACMHAMIMHMFVSVCVSAWLAYIHTLTSCSACVFNPPSLALSPHKLITNTHTYRREHALRDSIYAFKQQSALARLRLNVRFEGEPATGLGVYPSHPLSLSHAHTLTSYCVYMSIHSNVEYVTSMTTEWVVTYTYKCHITRMNESHVVHINESRHEWIKS